MKARSIGIMSAGGGTAVLFVLAAAFLGSACEDGEPPLCCPYVSEFSPVHEYVCIKCLDVGPSITAVVKHADLGNGKACAPAKGKPTIEIARVGATGQPWTKFDNDPVGSGIYKTPQGGAQLPMQDTSTFRLSVTASDSRCPSEVDVAKKVGVEPVPHEIKITAVKSGITHKELCFGSPDQAPDCTWQGNTKLFGKGVVIDRVENPSVQTSVHAPVLLNIDHAGKTVEIDPGQDDGGLYQGVDPNGFWAYEIPEEEPDWDVDWVGCDEVDPDRKLCADVYLDCNCP